MKPYGEIFKELRVDRGMSQKEVADALVQLGLDVNNAHVSRWENGSNKPSLEHFIALCHLFDIDDVQSVFGNGPMMGLTEGLNQQGIHRLQEFHQLLAENPKYAIDRSSLSDDGLTSAPTVLLGARPDECRNEDGIRTLPVYKLWDKDPLEGDNYEMVEVDPFVPETAQLGVLVNGNAMDPHLPHGSRVWIEPVGVPRPNDVLLVRFNRVLYVRLYQRSQNGILLVPFNPVFHPFVVSGTDEFRVIGRVAWLPCVNPEPRPQSIPVGARPAEEKAELDTPAADHEEKDASPSTIGEG